MRTLSSRTDSGDASRAESSGPGAEASSGSRSSQEQPGLSWSSAFSRAGTAARAGLSALGTGLVVLTRGIGALARGGLAAGSVLGRGIVLLGRGAAVAGRVTGRAARFGGARVRRWRIPERCGRAVLAVAAASALAGVRIWLASRVLLASRGPRGTASRSSRRSQASRRARGRTSPSRSSRTTGARRTAVRLTARGGIVIMFSTCFAGLLLADWTDWPELADAVFFMASSLTAYYTRPGSLLPVAVSPPLLFFAAMAIEKSVVATGTLAVFEGTLVMLASAATWLFAGTALTLTIALLRGLPREIRALAGELRG